MTKVYWYTGEARAVLQDFPDRCVQCVVTSPPYFGLRDYGTATWAGGDPACDHRAPDEAGATTKPSAGQREHAGRFAGPACHRCGATRIDSQIGLEATPDAYVQALVEVFREVRRVLRDDGTVWLNLGDSYCNAESSRNGEGLDGQRRGGATGADGALGYKHRDPRRAWRTEGIKHKDLIGIPWRVAFALQADGWYLRQDIIWAKPNPMPESVRDRCTKAHEYVFLLTKSARYYWDTDANREPSTNKDPRSQRRSTTVAKGPMRSSDLTTLGLTRGRTNESCTHPMGRNRRSVWTITPKPFKGTHFATFPPALVESCLRVGTSDGGACATCGAPYQRVIEKGAPRVDQQQACGANADGTYTGTATKAYAEAGAQDASAVKARILAGMVEKTTVGWRPTCGCPAGPTMPCWVLDPFAGSGTVLVVAEQLGRSAAGIDLNANYRELWEQRRELGT